MNELAAGALQIMGTIYIEIFINGVGQGLKEVLGMIEYSTTPKSKTITQVSKDKATAGQVTAVSTQNEPTEIKIKFSAFDRLIMAMALMGESSAVDVASAVVSDRPVTAKLDCFVKLGYKNLSEVSAVTNAAVIAGSPGYAIGAKTYVEGVDYTINYALGMIQALSSGEITEAQALQADLTQTAYSGFVTRGGIKSSFEMYILVDGQNQADGDDVEFEVYRAHLSASSAVDFMSDKFSELEMSGFMQTPPGKTEPFRLEKRKSA